MHKGGYLESGGLKLKHGSCKALHLASGRMTTLFCSGCIDVLGAGMIDGGADRVEPVRLICLVGSRSRSL